MIIHKKERIKNYFKMEKKKVGEIFSFETQKLKYFLEKILNEASHDDRKKRPNLTL